MIELEQLVQRFVGVWNETDSKARRATIETLWTVDGRHLMGASDVGGYDALETRVLASHERSVVQGGNTFRPATAIRRLGDVVKFRWEMAKRDSGEITSSGVGFLKIDQSGKISSDYLFVET